jgi:hypothetical protein
MIEKQGIFSDPWLPAAMPLPADALRSRVVTGPMPGYGPGRVAALTGVVIEERPSRTGKWIIEDNRWVWAAGIPPEIRQRAGLRGLGFDPQPEPPGKLRAFRRFAPSFGCCAGFGQAPTDPITCIARGGVWNLSTMLCQMPATTPPGPPSEPTPATPPLPSLEPALCSAKGGVWNPDTSACVLPSAAPAPTPSPAAAPTPSPAPAAEAAPSGMPTWAYVGIAGAIVVVVAAVALS